MQHLENISRSHDPDPSIINRTGKYLWKHRGKIAVGGALCAAGLAFYGYYSMSNNSKESDEEKFLMSEVNEKAGRQV